MTNPVPTPAERAAGPSFAEMLLTAHYQHIAPCPGEPCSCHYFEDLAIIRATLASQPAAESQREALTVERLVSLMENEGVVTWGDAGHRQRFLAALREQPREPGEEG